MGITLINTYPEQIQVDIEHEITGDKNTAFLQRGRNTLPEHYKVLKSEFLKYPRLKIYDPVKQKLVEDQRTARDMRVPEAEPKQEVVPDVPNTPRDEIVQDQNNEVVTEGFEETEPEPKTKTDKQPGKESSKESSSNLFRKRKGRGKKRHNK